MRVAPALSVVVPVYNAEAYLVACAESILGQTFEDFELVLVDDGSTDGSRSLCEDLARRDGRVVSVRQENGGVAAARNAGLDIVRAPLVAFVDSDDWVHPDYLTELVGLLEGSAAEMAVCGAVFEGPDGPEEVVASAGPVRVEPADAERFVELNLRLGLFAPWAKLFRRELVDRHRVRFDVELLAGEDLRFNYDYLDHCREIRVSDRALYHYRRHVSDSVSSRFLPRRFESDITLWEVLHGFFARHGLMGAAAERFLFTRLFWNVMEALVAAHHPDAGLGPLGRLARTRQILRYPHVPRALASGDTQDTPSRLLFTIRHRLALATHLQVALHASRDRAREKMP